MKESSWDIATFQRIEQQMVAKNESAWTNEFPNYRVNRLIDYKPDEINNIINGRSLDAQQKLSRNYFNKNGFYKRILLYYATLLKYTGLLVPNPSFGKQLSTSYLSKNYYRALEYLDKVNIPELLTRFSLRTLIYGSYYGVIKTIDKESLIILDLPTGYAASRFKDIYGNDLVTFNVAYFDSILDDNIKKDILGTYPEIISSYYNRWSKGKVVSSWVALPADIGVCFSFFDDGYPLFINMIPATIQYDEAVETERERQLDEIKKILVQKMPHLNDGQLVFEPQEALEMHQGAVDMMKSNKYLSVLTTYADVDSIVSKTSAENAANSLEKMLQNVYAEAGISGQLFAATGSQALLTSIKNDIALMMILGNKYSRFFTYIINKLFSNTNMNFNYEILPISYYNQSEYITDTFKLAQSGYSFILPALASGVTQKEFVNLKSLENDVLNLQKLLIPLQSAYTQSSGTVGAPEKPVEQKSEKTIKNEEAIDNQGGSNG